MSALSSAHRMRGRGPPAGAAGRGAPGSAPRPRLRCVAGSQRSASSTKGRGRSAVETGVRGADPLRRQVGLAGRDGDRERAPIAEPLSAVIEPPCSRPAPAPARGRCPSPRACALRALDPVEALEDVRHLLGGMPVPVSLTLELDAIVRRRRRDRDAPLEGELEGVGQEVEDDLLPHVPVDVDRLGQGGQSTTSASPARSQAERKLLASSAVKVARSIGS